MRRSPKRARARRDSHSLPVITSSEYPRKATIEDLSNEVLLNIFRYYLDASPRFWPRLVHTCRKWRQIVFSSQRDLHLRLFCTHGTPVLKNLDCWPALPIVVEYGGLPALDPPTPNDQDNIMAALKHSDRISSISLTATIPLLKKLSAIERPFSELTDVVLLSRNKVRLAFPSTFRWGSRLRTLHLTRAAIPTLPELLSHSTCLVDLQLHEIPTLGYFSPEAFAAALSGMTQLQSLSLHFLSESLTRRQSHHRLAPQSGERVVLPSLTHLKYEGTGKYLNSLVAIINAPRLGDITLSQPTMDNSQLIIQFISQIEMQKSQCQADILFSESAATISFTRPEASTRLKLQVFCEDLAQQLSYMAQTCTSISTSLFGIEHLCINATQSLGRWHGDYQDWRKLIQPFEGAKWVHVAGGCSTVIVLTLHCLRHGARRGELLLPALLKLCVQVSEPREVPLQEAVGLFIHTRQIRGHLIEVEYGPVRVNKLRGIVGKGVGPFPQHVTIEMLPEDVLLNIFTLYLYSSPQFWPTLTHVSRRWRNIVFTSPLGLDLRLYCTYGTPVSKTLNYWPALPIVVQYGGGTELCPPAPEDEDNIVAALKHSDRVSSIGLTITSSLLQKLFSIEMSFSDLEELVLRSLDSEQLTLPSTFRWGTRLRTLQSTRIAIPSLLSLLSPSTGLVDLQLHEIPNSGYFSPDAFASALSEMTQLETLSLHFFSSTPRRKHLGLPPQSWERVVLPALRCLKYRGTSKYLDSLVARIDAPGLRDIDITFFNQPTMDASQLGRFVERIEMKTSLSRAEVQFSEHAISISFTRTSGPTRLALQVSCQQLDWQLSSIAQICDHMSLFTSCVEDLSIKVMQLSLATGQDLGQDRIDCEQWLKFVRSFRGVKDFYVDEKLVSDILVDLDLARKNTVFPSLRTFRVLELEPMRRWFTSLRLHKSRRVPVYGPELSCKICLASFTEQQELKKHLVVRHAYRLACPYCGDFEFAPRYSDLFREHLTSKHPDVTQSDTLISTSPAIQSSSPSYSGGQDTQTNELRVSTNFGAFTMFKASKIQIWFEAEKVTELPKDIHFLPSPYPTWLS